MRSEKGDDSFSVFRTISLNSKSGTRGKVVTATGAGYKDGTTATVWLDKDDDQHQTSDEPVLCTVLVERLTPSLVTLQSNVPPFEAGNTINAFHGRGKDGAPLASAKGASWGLSPRSSPFLTLPQLATRST